jgi:hypothetical protein
MPLTGIALVLAIAGLLLFMAVPARPLDAASQAAQRAELELRRGLEELRGAIDEYRLEHGRWPGSAPPLGDPGLAAVTAPDELWFARQLELFSDREGRTVPRRLATHPYGPYLTHGVPLNPLNGSSKIRFLGPEEDFPLAPEGPWGWIYSPTTGELRANVSGSFPTSSRRIFDL